MVQDGPHLGIRWCWFFCGSFNVFSFFKLHNFRTASRTVCNNFLMVFVSVRLLSSSCSVSSVCTGTQFSMSSHFSKCSFATPSGNGMGVSNSSFCSSGAETKLAFLEQLQMVSFITLFQLPASMCSVSKTEGLFAIMFAFMLLLLHPSSMASIILARISWRQYVLSVRIMPISQG